MTQADVLINSLGLPEFMYYSKQLNQSVKKMRFSHLLVVVLMLLISSMVVMTAEAEVSPSMKQATFMPLWTPQAQFAGYYLAYEKGLYAKQGIDLKILKAGPGYSPAEAVNSGKADFAVMWLSTALRQRSQGTEIVNLAQLVQKSSLILVTKKTTGIAKLEDMHDKKVGLWGGDLSMPIMSLFNKKKIKVKEIQQSYTVNLFLRGGIDVASAMWYNEYHTILSSGLNPEELNLFFMSKYDMNFPEDGIYALKKTIDKDPALAGAFVKASLEGWNYAFAHPEEAVEITLKYMREAGLPANSTHQKWMLNRMRDLFQPLEGGKFGELNPQSYDFVVNSMKQDKMLIKHADYQQFSWKANADKPINSEKQANAEKH